LDATVDDVASLGFMDHASIRKHLRLIVVVTVYVEHWSIEHRDHILEVVVGEISATYNHVDVAVVLDQVLRVDSLVYNIAQS
jgi:hypothetical protein